MYSHSSDVSTPSSRGYLARKPVLHSGPKLDRRTCGHHLQTQLQCLSCELHFLDHDLFHVRILPNCSQQRQLTPSSRRPVVVVVVAAAATAAQRYFGQCCPRRQCRADLGPRRFVVDEKEGEFRHVVVLAQGLGNDLIIPCGVT